MIIEIGFLQIHWTDIVDIGLVTWLFYRLHIVMRGTIAVQIFLGLLVIIAASFIVQALELKALSWILTTLTDIWVIAFIILFQPELRRLLVMLGRGRLMTRFYRYSLLETINEIVEACDEMSKRQIGALIVIERATGIRTIKETGSIVRAEVTRELLLSIFNPKAPLHDGAVVIKDRTIEAARCTLPLTAHLQLDGFVMGMRHRSALGVSEQTDSIAIVVSEETGIISLAVDGHLQRRLNPETLRSTLQTHLNVRVKSEFDSTPSATS